MTGMPLTPLPHYARGEFENTALFLWLGLPSTLFRTENGAFEDVLQTGGIWKRRLWSFSVDGKHFENGVFQKKKWRLSNAVINPNSQGCAQALLPPLIAAFEERFRKAPYSPHFFHFLPAVFRAKPQLTERLEEASIVRPARVLTLFLLGKGRREILGTR